MNRQRGFTIVEVIIAMTILAILTAISVPTFRSVVENGHIRAVSESMQYGLTLARTEAVRLNTQVAFVTSASGWTVQRVDDASQLHQGSGKESMAGLLITKSPSTADTVTFNAFGRTIDPNPDNSERLASITLAASAETATERALRIQVTAGGVSRVCDPNAASSELRACL
jgi:type IV fimbrial biogenesis protein FimT